MAVIKAWMLRGQSFFVTYDDNESTGGDVPVDDTEYKNGDTVTVSANTGTLARTGYTFDGWNTAADGSGSSYTAGSGTFVIAGDTTLYAKWAALPGKISATGIDCGGAGDATPASATLLTTAQEWVVDGVKTFGYSCVGNRSIGVNLGSSKQISYGVFYFYASAEGRTGFWPVDAYRTLRLYSSDDNSTWTLRKEVIGAAWESVSSAGGQTLFKITITPDSPFSAQYIKAWTNGLADNNGDWVYRAEAEAWN